MSKDLKTVFDVPCGEIEADVRTGKIYRYNDDFLAIFGIDSEYAKNNTLYVHDYCKADFLDQIRQQYMKRYHKAGSTTLCYMHKIESDNGQHVAFGVTEPSEKKDTFRSTIIDVSDFYDDGTLDHRRLGFMFKTDSMMYFRFKREDFNNRQYISYTDSEQKENDTQELKKLYIKSADRELLFGTLEQAWGGKFYNSHSVDFAGSLDGENYSIYRANFYAVFGADSEKTYIVGRIIEINDSDDADPDENSLTVGDTLSSIDTLTGLILYRKFRMAMKAYLETRDPDRTLAVVYLDINNFAYINENFGFEAGNKVLIDTAKIIKSNSSVIAASRIHSDLFAAAIEGSSEESVLAKTEKIGKVFSLLHSRKFPRNDINLTAGIYFVKPEDSNVRQMVDNANTARRSIKDNRQQWLCVFNDEIRAKRLVEQEIRSTIHQSIENGEIEAFLQPKFSMKEMRIIGAEALARWKNPDGSYKQPWVFIPVLENNGYVIDLDFEIFRQVLFLIKKWVADGIQPLPISVNFSRVHNNYKNFVSRVEEMVTEIGVDPKYIEIEITESVIAGDPDVVTTNMKAFADFGFGIDMDDFGTGYSSLSFLRDAPVDVVKVDKTFVDKVNASEKDNEYVKQLCQLIRSTEKDVIFEGVETKEQVEFFTSCGFDMAQGWLFDKAIPIPEFNKKYMYVASPSEEKE